MNGCLLPSLLLGGCCLLALEPTTAMAGSKKVRPTSTPVSSAEAPLDSQSPVEAKSGSLAHVRLWKASDTKENAVLQIRWVPVGTSSDKGSVIATNSDSYQFTGYNDVPAGIGAFEIVVPDQTPVRLGADLAKERNFTLLVRVRQGVASAELLDYTTSLSTDTPVFSVYNLMPGGKGDVQIKLGDELMARLSAAGGSLSAQGIKAAFYQITVNGTDTNGQALHWNTEADLRKVPRTTIIICPDAYGRIRPRLIDDGANPETSPEKAPSNKE